jgi:hypothetical protein
VVFNGEEIKTFPKERDPNEFAKSFLNALTGKWGSQEASKYVEGES